MALPDYLTEQTEDAILSRMKDVVPDDIDKSEGSFIHDALAPAAIEFALFALKAQEVLERAFASTTFGDYLDLRAEEHGLTRKAAVKATGQVTFAGTQGTVIPASTVVATPADAVTGAVAIEFKTKAQVTIGVGGTIGADIEASEGGLSGNVAAGKITLMGTSLAGVTSVTNAAETSGGADEESDADLLARYLSRVQNPSAGGNKADYINWAQEVVGIGGASVVPVRDGAGTVSIALIGTDKAPASQTLVDAVQDYIAPPWEATVQAENMTLGGAGVSVDATQGDDEGDSVKMAPAVGDGTLYHANPEASLVRPDASAIPGIWTARPRMKVDNNGGVADLLTIGMYNISTASWCKTRPAGAIDALLTLQANDLSTAFSEKVLDFYWNGADNIELRITRLDAEDATTVWIDEVLYRSAFSKDTGDGKAPVGARVTCEAATAVAIDVQATLTIAEGYSAASVKAACEAAIEDYIKSLAYAADNDVRYVRIGQAILDTAGVSDYANLVVNGGAANIAIGEQAVAIKGTVTLS